MRYLEREIGVLHLPRPDRASLKVSTQPARADPVARLLGMAALYAMVEDELWEEVRRLPAEQRDWKGRDGELF